MNNGETGSHFGCLYKHLSIHQQNFEFNLKTRKGLKVYISLFISKTTFLDPTLNINCNCN